MRCFSCGRENPQEARFCTACGRELRLAEGRIPFGPERPTPARSKGLSTASLVLGILSLFFNWLAGIPAIITGVIALAGKRPGQARAIAGIVLGAALPIFASIVLALLIPNYVLFQERARRSSVKNNMHVVQTALEAYACDHFGNYPSADVSWEPNDESGICVYFPGGDPIGAEGSPIPGNFPVNPYTGERYNDPDENVMDLDYLTLYGMLEPGQCARLQGGDGECPYIDFGGIPDCPGGIGVATFVQETQAGFEAAQEYGIFGFGRNTEYPMYELDPVCADAEDEAGWIFFVLHN